MGTSSSLADRISASLSKMSPAEQRVAGYFQRNREQVLITSASALAKEAGVSDATVIRTTRTLGFTGMDDLRRTLAAELKEDLTPVSRLARTLREVGDRLEAAFDVTLETHQKALESLRERVSAQQFKSAVEQIVDARRVAVFGIGPSSWIAGYFSFQLARFGVESFSITDAGLLLADGIQKLKESDLIVAFAYTRVYRELAVLLDQANQRGASIILVTDTLGEELGKRVDLVLNVARGRAEMLSMHTATIGLLEMLLVGVATMRPDKTLSGLSELNALRAELVGNPDGLP